MIETFVTVLAWIVFVVCSVVYGLMFIGFASLTPWQQRACKINVNVTYLALYVSSIAWIITSWFY